MVVLVNEVDDNLDNPQERFQKILHSWTNNGMINFDEQTRTTMLNLQFEGDEQCNELVIKILHQLHSNSGQPEEAYYSLLSESLIKRFCQTNNSKYTQFLNDLSFQFERFLFLWEPDESEWVFIKYFIAMSYQFEFNPVGMCIYNQVMSKNQE